MAAEVRLKIARRLFEELVNAKNFDIAEEIFSPRFGELHPRSGPYRGVEWARRYFGQLFACFPDLQYRIEETITDGESVVLRLVGRGTQLGTYMGAPPSGRRVEFVELLIIKFADDKVFHFFVQPDRLRILLEIGALPPHIKT